MEKKAIRLLNANEIDCRVATIGEKGVSLLLYKNARVDQTILDETFGIFGWKRSHQSIDGNLFCTVSIYDEDKKEWISKQDVGNPGFTEHLKSAASDSFKRAAFNFGVGRELYSAPFIWIPASKIKINEKDGKYYCNSKFNVKEIGYNESREILKLVICDEKGSIVFEMAKQVDAAMNELTERQKACLKAELKRTGVTGETVKARYNLDNLNVMPENVYNRMMYALGKTENAKVA